MLFAPLTPGELQHALAIEPESTDLDEEDIMDANNITVLCVGLIIVDQGTNMVNLVQYTAKKYLESIHLDRFPGFDTTITMSCPTYLALATLRNANIWAIVQRYPQACYAAQYMGDHARHHPEHTLELSLLEMVYRLLSHPDKRKPLLSLLDSLDLIKSGFYSSSWIRKVKDDTASSSGTTMVNTDTDHDGRKKPSLEDPALSDTSAKPHSQPASLR